MIQIRYSLMLLLVLLQLIAPLVHAHVDAHFSAGGIHIPGLEVHAPEDSLPGLKATACLYQNNNLIVSVHSGIQPLCQGCKVKPSFLVFVPAYRLVKTPAVIPFYYRLSARYPSLNLRIIFPAAPRAPPYTHALTLV